MADKFYRKTEMKIFQSIASENEVHIAQLKPHLHNALPPAAHRPRQSPAESGVALGHVVVADRVDNARGRLLLQLHPAPPLLLRLLLIGDDRQGGPRRVVLDAVLAQQLLQLHGLLVAQIEETVAWMMGVQAELGAVGADPALGAHHEAHAAAAAELVLALAAREVHATCVWVCQLSGF